MISIDTSKVNKIELRGVSYYTSVGLARAQRGNSDVNFIKKARAAGKIRRPDGSSGVYSVTAKDGFRATRSLYYIDSTIISLRRRVFGRSDRSTTSYKTAAIRDGLYEYRVEESDGTWGPWRSGFTTKKEAEAWMRANANTFTQKKLVFKLTGPDILDN